ncbi:MAG TPA: lysophospholipid acyltransferase family protein [Elusimicrobiales bacterium]|nr:lysophospholipid acyltransferase family protein [Elusimicrobiales bacterium]
MFIKLVRNLTTFILKNAYNLKIEGIEKVPAKGKLIFVCNHLSNIDPPIIEIAINKIRHARFVVKKELMKVPIVAYIFRKQNYIAIDRKKPGGDLRALRNIIGNINREHCVVIFPEGTRSKSGTPLDPKLGIGFVACKTNAPVLCARIFRTGKFPFTKNLLLKIGNMVECDNVKSSHKEESRQMYQEFSKKIMSEIFSIQEKDTQVT